MMGAKKLSTIRQVVEQALASDGQDAIQRLERQIASAKRKGNSTEVIEELKRFLERPQTRTAKGRLPRRPQKAAGPST